MEGISLALIIIVIGVVSVKCNVDNSKTQSFIGYVAILIGIIGITLLILEKIGLLTAYE